MFVENDKSTSQNFKKIIFRLIYYRKYVHIFLYIPLIVATSVIGSTRSQSVYINFFCVC